MDLGRLSPGYRVAPRSIGALRNYSFQKFSADLVAGCIVGLVAVPLAMAFAISSGVPPQAGLYGAIVAGFVVSALGGSTTQIAGPTGAFVVVVAGIIQAHGLDGLFMCTLLAGLMLVLMGLTGLGTAVKFIPRPVVIGFTNGIAVLIASTQIRDFLGLDVDKVPGEFLARMETVIGHLGTLSVEATCISVGSLATVFLFGRYFRKFPGTLAVLVGATTVAAMLRLPVETVATQFGSIPSGLPEVRIPQFRADLVLPLLSPALTVTILGAIESLLSAVVADRMTGDRHDPNTELFAQGVANVLCPLVGGLPATGAIARTATNIRAGAKTPVAGMIHSAVILIVVLVAAPLAERVPLSALAAILLVVAYNMGEWAEIPKILKMGKADVAVWLITFGLTVLADLTVAVEAGMILAALLYIARVTSTTTVSRVTPEYIEQGHAHSLQSVSLPEGVAVYRIHGPFLFGSADKLRIIEDDLESLPPVVILRLRNMNAVDATGLHALESLAERLRQSGRHLVLCGMREQPARLIDRSAFYRHIGKENIVGSISAAAARARELLGEGS